MHGQAHALHREPTDGFTLIELLVVMSIASTLMAIGIFGFMNWQRTAQQQGSASQLVSSLRNASERAISEGRTYCLDIDSGKSFTLWRYSCTTAAGGTKVEGQYKVQSTKVSYAATNTLPAGASCTGGHKCIYFYPRGTAVATTVAVNSTARSKVYTVHVEGLTARVWM
jgi:prepilin-type N-terminal cleavage/methylation domain-containing protein